MKPLSRDAQALVASARAAGEPSEAYRARMRRKLAAHIGGATVAAATLTAAAKVAAAEAAPVKATGLGLLAKVGLATVMLGVSAGGAAVLWRDLGGARATAQQSLAPLVAGLPLPSFEPSPEPQPDAPKAPAASPTDEAPTLDSPPARPHRPAASARGAARPSSRSPRPAPSRALNDELALLSRAQGALSSGQAGRALALLDEHAASYPEGALREERMAARVFALCALERREEARAEAQRFVESAPRSPLAARVRGACPAAESPAAKPE